MAISKIESIWQLLSTYNFKDSIPEEFHCIICKSVTIEPFTALCECRFCSECIQNYLKVGRKCCPGIKDDCKEYLEIDINVSRDIKAVRSIGRINVKCPKEMCEVRCDLTNMNDHVRVCGMTKTKCPYENIGCQLRQISGDNVKTHYDNEWFSHSKLLIEAIDNLRNDFEELKKVVERRDEEINTLNEDSMKREMTIKEMRIDIDILKEINESKDREMEEMKDEFRMMKETQKKTMMEELESVKKDIVKRDLNNNVLINTIKKQVDDQRKETEELKVKDERRNREMKGMEETQKKKMKEKWENVKKYIGERDVRGDIENQKKILNNLRVNQENIEREINSVITQVRDLRIFDEREFIWRVNNFSKMTEDYEGRFIILWRYSLKLHLYLWCNEDYLTFYCTIMKGEFDNILNWPMKHTITLSLINQDTMKIHKSIEYQCFSIDEDNLLYMFAFEKPKKHWNNFSIGDCNFITVDDIMHSPGLLLNDSLIVSFVIDYN